MSGSNARTRGVATTTTDVQISSLAGVLMGWSLRESAGTPAVATAYIRDGTSATAPIVAVIEFAANVSGTEWFGPQGIRINTGVYLDMVAGELEGAIFLA